jgi:hypothetical protein
MEAAVKESAFLSVSLFLYQRSLCDGGPCFLYFLALLLVFDPVVETQLLLEDNKDILKVTSPHQ